MMTHNKSFSDLLSGVIRTGLLLSFVGFFNPSAEAASAKVREACRDDYLKFCPAYEPETPKGRQCMRQMGRRLSKHCIDALADAGQIRRSNR